MKRKDLTKPFMVISNWKNIFGLHELYSNISALYKVLSLQRGYRLEMSESDVCRRQILTSKDDPRTVRVKKFLMANNISIQINRKELTKTFMTISLSL